MTTVIGVAVGTGREGIGVTVLSNGAVVEAVTVDTENIDAVGVGRVCRSAVSAGQGMTATLAGPLVWAVEDVTYQLAGSQQHRAAAARTNVAAARKRQLVLLAVILSVIPTGDTTLVVPAGDPVDPAGCPPVLVGTKPAGWAGTKGSRRAVQRTAWQTAVAGARMITPDPADPGTYVACLATVIRAHGPTGHDALVTVCAIALAVVPQPPSAPDLTPTDLATWATAHKLWSTQ